MSTSTNRLSAHEHDNQPIVSSEWLYHVELTRPPFKNIPPTFDMSTPVLTTNSAPMGARHAAFGAPCTTESVEGGLVTTTTVKAHKRPCSLKACPNPDCRVKIPCRTQTCKHCKTFIGLKDESKRRPAKPKAPLKRPASLKPCSNPNCDHMMGCKAKKCKKCGTVVDYKYAAKTRVVGVGRGQGRLQCTSCHKSHGTKKHRCDCGATNTWDKKRKASAKARQTPAKKSRKTPVVPQKTTVVPQKTTDVALNDFMTAFDDEDDFSEMEFDDEDDELVASSGLRPRAPSMVFSDDELVASSGLRPRAPSMMFSDDELVASSVLRPRAPSITMDDLWSAMGDPSTLFESI